MKYANAGTVSHGTLRSEDLISTFESLLRELCEANQTTKHTELLVEANGWLVRNTTQGDVDPEPLNNDDELGSELVDELSDALTEFAPPGHYFGAHEGDGSDFGFWPADEHPDDGLKTFVLYVEYRSEEPKDLDAVKLSIEHQLGLHCGGEIIDGVVKIRSIQPE